MESDLKFLVLPCYKNIPQIFFMKILDDKNSAIEYSENVRESLTSQINSRIDNNDTIKNEQKTYEFTMVQNNISIFIIGVNNEGKSNKLYNVKYNPKNNKKTLETIPINGDAELPQINVYEYVKKHQNTPLDT